MHSIKGLTYPTGGRVLQYMDIQYSHDRSVVQKIYGIPDSGRDLDLGDVGKTSNASRRGTNAVVSVKAQRAYSPRFGYDVMMHDA
jgi:hypothetical protein